METVGGDWPGTESRLYFRWFWMISNGRSFQAGEDLPDRRTNKNWEPQNKRASKVKIFLGTRSHKEVSWEGWHRGVEGVESEATGWESVYRSIKILYTILRNLDFIYFVCVEYLPCAQNCLDSQIKTQDPDSVLKETSISGGDRQIGVRRANIYRALTLCQFSIYIISCIPCNILWDTIRLILQMRNWSIERSSNFSKTSQLKYQSFNSNPGLLNSKANTIICKFGSSVEWNLSQAGGQGRLP